MISHTIDTQFFKVSLAGSSYDLRTNRWRVECKLCKKIYEPKTTMIRWQKLECPNCGVNEYIDYNQQSNEEMLDAK